MNKELKKQILLSGLLICLFMTTLIFWYPNFLFHTYIKEVDYQYCFSGQNEQLMISGFEVYQNSQDAIMGNGRLLALQNNFLLKDDHIDYTVTMKNQEGKTIQYQDELVVQSTNEALYFQQHQDEKQSIPFDVDDITMQVSIERQGQNIYDESIRLNKEDLVIYNASNKDYSLSNVYVCDSWMKSGYFATRNRNIAQEYSYYEMDYMYLKDNGDVEDINDYERILHLSGSIQELLENDIQDVYYYDDTGKLTDKEMICVITLAKDQNDQDPLIFMLELHGTIKAGV